MPSGKTSSGQSIARFSPDSISFLIKNHRKNDKNWFENHRGQYQKHILEPFRELAMELAGTMLSIDNLIETRPQINRTITKIYRDTRFSKDKSLFKENMWLTFKRPGKKWMDYPGFFFEILPHDGSYRYGMGFYQASRETMDKFRKSIIINPNRFKKTISPFSKNNLFEISGEKYKRSLPADIPNWLNDWYQRKSFYLVKYKKIVPSLYSSKLGGNINKQFILLKPIYQFIQKICSEKMNSF